MNNQLTQSLQINETNFMAHSNQFRKNYQQQQNEQTFENELQQVEHKLYNNIIFPYENQEKIQPQQSIIYRLSQQVQYSLEQNLKDIHILRNKLEIPTLNIQEKQQIKQKILEITMTQLANNRVLIHTYKHHEYRLVISLFHISKIYQELNCHHQVITHLTTALQMNENYLDIKEALYYHSLIQTYLAHSLCEIENFQESLQNLNRALEIHEQLTQNQFNLNDFITLLLISKVLSKLGKNQQAITYGKMALNSAEKNYTLQSFECAKAYLNLAEVQSKSQLIQQAIQHISSGIQTLQVHAPEKQDSIIQFHTKLTEISLLKLNLTASSMPQNFEPYMTVLKKRYDVIQNILGFRDKRCIKQKRHLASAYLKYGKINEAEEELQDILQIEEQVYGEKSVEVGKTLKMLGTVLISQKQIKKAQRCLKKSQSIFHDQGHTHLEKEVMSKLFLLTNQSKQRFYKN